MKQESNKSNDDLIYHSGCDSCCALGRCHFCLTQSGVFRAECDGVTYCACPAHKEQFQLILENDHRRPADVSKIVSTNPFLV